MQTLRVDDFTLDPSSLCTGTHPASPRELPHHGLCYRSWSPVTCWSKTQFGNCAPGLEQPLMLTLPFQTAPSTSSSFPPSCRRTGSPASPEGELGRSRMTTARENERADQTATLPTTEQQNSLRFYSGVLITARSACPVPSSEGLPNLCKGNSREGGRRALCFSNTSQLMMPESAWHCALGPNRILWWQMREPRFFCSSGSSPAIIPLPDSK